MKKHIKDALENNKGRVSTTQKTANKEVTQYLDAVKEFEKDRIELAKESAKKAWRVAASLGVCLTLSLVAVATLAPLKESVPYLIEVENSTGAVQVLRPFEDARSVSYDDVLDEYWSRKYIEARNSYDWQTIQDNYNLVTLMSDNIVGNTYQKKTQSENSPVVIYEDKRRINVDVQDVSFLPTQVDDHRLAQVRFSREIVKPDGTKDTEYDTTYWNATITFDYLAEINTADERHLNPLGFRVKSYSEVRVNKK